MISIIVAADNNLAIGAKNKIPWRLRDDLVLLKKLTLDHTVILGRKSYDSMVGYYDKSGRPMPGGMYIVVTRDPDYKPARHNARVAHSIDEAIKQAVALGDDHIFAIGGGDVFAGMLPHADRIYFTKVDTSINEPDAFFPTLDMNEWREVSHEHHQKDDRNEYDYDLIIYERR